MSEHMTRIISETECAILKAKKSETSHLNMAKYCEEKVIELEKFLKELKGANQDENTK